MAAERDKNVWRKCLSYIINFPQRLQHTHLLPSAVCLQSRLLMLIWLNVGRVSQFEIVVKRLNTAISVERRKNRCNSICTFSLAAKLIVWNFRLLFSSPSLLTHAILQFEMIMRTWRPANSAWFLAVAVANARVLTAMTTKISLFPERDSVTKSERTCFNF